MTIAADHALLLGAVRAAGQVARECFRHGVEHWEKAPGDPVSEADLLIDQMLRDRLSPARPGYGWLSEESGAEHLDAKRCWVVDPIDGTRAFIAGRPEFSVSVALIEGDATIAAAVYDPVGNRLYDAVRGAGARCNGVTIEASVTDRLAGCRMLASPDLITSPRWPEPWPAMTVTRKNSIALRIALVAAGDHDASLSLRPVADWDIAAAALILQEAGGKISDGQGNPLRWSRGITRHPHLIASGTGLYPEILRRVAPRLPSKPEA